MNKSGFDKLAFLAVLSAVALVVLAAAGTGPAYSESRSDSATVHRGSSVDAPSAEVARAASPSQPRAAEERGQARNVDTEGYEWSGSRPADERYLWSHQTK